MNTNHRISASGSDRVKHPENTIRFAGSCGNLVGIDQPVQAAGESSPAKLPTMKLNAYNGGALRQWWSNTPIVVDLETLQLSRNDIPVLRDHDPGQVIGHTTAAANDKRSLSVEGVVSAVNQYADEVVKSAKNGYPWQVSIGADAGTLEMVPAGQSVTVNGQNFPGPVRVARNAKVMEISIVAIGADTSTSGSVAATGANEQHQKKGADMGFEKWLEAKGFDSKTISDAQRASLQAMYDSEQKTKVEPEPKKIVEASGGADVLKAASEAAIKATREESARVAKIEALTPGDAFAKIRAQAISEGWTTERTELEVLRASRSGVGGAPGVIVSSGNAPAMPTIEAAFAMQCGMSEKAAAKTYGEKIVDAAVSGKVRAMGSLHGLIRAIGAANGIAIGKINAETLHQLKASGSGFSNVSLAGTLNNVANKLLLSTFIEIPRAVPTISRKRTVPDFKSVEGYRISEMARWEKVSEGGEIKSGNLAEDKFTNKADTWGQIKTLTRQQIINDDLDAFSQIPNMYARGAANILERTAFSLLAGNANSFFGTGNKNNQSGGSTALSIGSLTAALTLFRNQTDKAGDPIMLNPDILLVPAALEVAAMQLFNDRMVNETTTANAPKVNSNPHAGKFRPVVSPYLDLTSATQWYLLANPAIAAVLEVAYVDGIETPVIEEVPTPGDILGMSWRGYFDFGVALQDPKAGVRSVGA